MTENDAWHDQVRELVERSCTEQGVPVKVTDPTTLRRVATLFGAAGGARHE